MSMDNTTIRSLFNYILRYDVRVYQTLIEKYEYDKIPVSTSGFINFTIGYTNASNTAQNFREMMHLGLVRQVGRGKYVPVYPILNVEYRDQDYYLNGEKVPSSYEKKRKITI
ncbi:hypothetical protein [Paenibacillus sp. LPE1-1-1.1]|uniref:hypothetical protein n=1 Tax=Paenibacillus sp. LPE1-1-1.1 TaxID=3135230 RepID=UPI00342EEBBD